MAKSGLSGSSETLKIIKDLEPELFKEIRKSVNSELKPVLTPIEGEINSQVTQTIKSAMPGMFHNGRSAWNGAKLTVRVSTRPRELIFINGDGQNRQVGFDYAELAGIRRRPPRSLSRQYMVNGQPRKHRVNGQGDAFISKLQSEFGKPGRFAWIRVLKRKPEVERKVQDVADKFGIKLSRRLA